MSDAAAEYLDVLAQYAEWEKYNRLETYDPYPFQREFHSKKGHNTDAVAEQVALICANQIGKCHTNSVVIKTSKGRKKLKEVWGKDVEVLTPTGFKPVKKWVRKPAEECFRVLMSDGQWFECPKSHRILTPAGFSFVGDVLSSLPKSAAQPMGRTYLGELLLRGLDCLPGGRRGVYRWIGTVRGLWGRYLVDPRLCGGQLLYDQEDAQVWTPLLDGVQPHNGHLWHVDDRVGKGIGSLFHRLRRLSNQGVGLLTSALSVFYQDRGILYDCPLYACDSRESLPFHEVAHLRRGVSVTGTHQVPAFSWLSPECDNQIIAYWSVGLHTLYDLEVEGHAYIAAGVVHHNTTAGGSEAAYHALGEYPDWWEGLRFKKPVTILCAGVSNDSTKRIIQNELLGGMLGTPSWGTGTVPKDRLGKPTRKAGVPDAYESFTVKGKYGDSTIWLMAYEQGWQKFQGIRFDCAWPDEEPPMDIMSQLLRGTISREQSRIAITMTPEEGVTDVVNGFINDLKTGQALVTATWEEASHDDDTENHKVGDTHLTEEKKAQILDALPSHQREMRSKGIPMMGSGLIFPLLEDEIVIEPVEIHSHWAQVIGIDFGVDHPFGAVRLCWDKDADIVYLTNEYRETGKTPPIHAEHIRHWGNWVPVMWPHDGLIRDKGSGVRLYKVYKDCGLNMHYEKFSNPPNPGQKEGQGGQGVEAGLMEMLMRMESGRFKVFSTCTQWREEYRMYHRKNGQIVKLRDDLISASRYAHQMLRWAQNAAYQYSGQLKYRDERAIV